MLVRGIEKNDFDFIVSTADRWWGGLAAVPVHPIFFHEFGQYALIAEDEDQVVGFLLGFVVGDLGYIHLVGIDPEHRRRGIAKRLYEDFEQKCRAQNATLLRAITTVGNSGSVAFHASQGFEIQEIADYAGAGRPRILFEKTLS